MPYLERTLAETVVVRYKYYNHYLFQIIMRFGRQPRYIQTRNGEKKREFDLADCYRRSEHSNTSCSVSTRALQDYVRLQRRSSNQAVSCVTGTEVLKIAEKVPKIARDQTAHIHVHKLYSVKGQTKQCQYQTKLHRAETNY